MADKSSRSSLLIVLVLVVAGMLLAYAYFRGQEVSSKRDVPSTYTQVDAGVAPPPMTEEERIAYVKAHVTVSDLEIGPDMKPGLDEPVPGLLRVHGKVENAGDREIDRVFLQIYPQDAEGKVIGSYMENVAKKKGGLFRPGEVIDFKFTIPDKKDFAGTFEHDLK